MIRSAPQLPERIPGAPPFRAPATHFGPGAVERVADEAGRLGARRALVISDPGVEQAGIAGRVRDLLEGAGVATALYAEVEPEPSVASIERAPGAAGAPGGPGDPRGRARRTSWWG